jgi:pyridoxamine 5'-phosphate oxidase
MYFKEYLMEKNKIISEIRKEYKFKHLDREHISESPLIQLESWLQEAIKSEINEPTAMVLSTVSDENKPSSRVVLLKGISSNGLVFFTNYLSRKGNEISNSPFAAINFFWPELERQIRVEGKIIKTPASESDQYFSSRPRGSQLGAIISPQSEIIPDRKFLEDKIAKIEKEYDGKEIKRPSHWGGYELIPDYFEFWQGRPSRLHDRLSYFKEGDRWKIERLAP